MKTTSRAKPTAFEAMTLVVRAFDLDANARGERFAKVARGLSYTGLLGRRVPDDAGETVLPLQVFTLTDKGFRFEAEVNPGKD
jgi:hypothetical protein